MSEHMPPERAEQIRQAKAFSGGLMSGDDAAADRAYAELVRLRSGEPSQAELRVLAPDAVAGTLAALARLASGEDRPIPTGLHMLDDQLDGGFWPGLHMLVGGTGGGKTQLAMQSALRAAIDGTAVTYVLLEMGVETAMLRVLGELADVPWPLLMRARASEEQMERVRDAAERVPSTLALEQGLPFAWPAARVELACQDLRRRSPDRTPLLVIDYGQLAGSLDDDVRQRVMRVAYAAQAAANRHRIAVVYVSSTARPGYGALADIVARGKLGDRSGDYPGSTTRTVGAPQELIGLGKESGELEYSAETVTVIGSGGEDEQSRVLVAVTAKRRTGAPSWCALRFASGRLREDRGLRRIADLPAAPESDEDLDERVRNLIGSERFTSEAELRRRAKAGTDRLNESLGRLERRGVIRRPAKQRQPFTCVKAGEPDEGFE